MSDATRAAANAADANMLRDRVTAAFGEQYLIGPEIGRGGMAVVYSAEDLRLQRQVALKVLPPDLAFRSDVRERFVREAQTAARLNHPHIVPIYAVHEQAGMVCFAMGLVTGESVAARLARDPRPPVEFIASVLEQTADALAYAHACGVVHRDVKPDNILLDRDSGRAMVTDFGIARAAESGSRLTQTGIAVGTPAFMSPEQATGDRDVDGRSDLYSLGVVGYLMLAGRLPFEATTTPAMLVKHVSETPPPIHFVRPDAPGSLVGILERCLAKRPADRWDSALVMRDALRRVQRDGSLKVLGGGPSRSADRASNTPRDRVASEYADKAGHRSEDWSPRGVFEPAPAPRQLPAPAALPPMPHFPPLSPLADREEQREWKAARRDALRDWRHAVKDQRRATRDQWRDGLEFGVASYGETAFPGRSDEELIGRFKGQMAWTAGMIVFLGVINAITSRHFPWAVFPAMGMTMGVIGRYARLRARGITWSRIWDDDPDAQREPTDAAGLLPKPKRIARAARAFKRHLKWLAGSAAVAVGSFAIGGAFHLNPMIAPFVAGLIGSLVSAQLLIVDYVRLRRFGVSPTEALGDGWKEIAAVADDRPRYMQLNEVLERIAGPAVLMSSHGETVRSAVDDRMTIKDTASRLSDADKAMVPDVEPTADALLERIGALASGLERLERDVPGDAIAQLDARIAVAQAEPETAPDHERRLALLTRQRASLQELVDRRVTMQRQLESASMALRSLRFDMVKLRTLGVGAAIGDVTSATQEARALSLDIGRALYAAEEVRKL
ncbi:MAG: protein kinase [Gemmatimonadaceae bacterium]|nr:protein kinase [Gemmatimonadaceae bacterium]